MPKINFSSSNIENKNNKITSFTVGSSSNSNSTYPSTKAVSAAVSNYVAANTAPVTIIESGNLDGWYYHPIINLTPLNGGELFSCSINALNKDTCTFYLFNTRSITRVSPRILLNGYGRWK